MISGYHHVSLDGVRYRLAEDAEGEHYNLNRQPLRLQTSAVVQGESGKFQLRPDLLEWTMSDWSGGEGQVLWDEKSPNRYFISHNVDAFVKPGRLRLADGYEMTTDDADVALNEAGFLTKGRNALWLISTNDDEILSWNNAAEHWNDGITNAEAGFGDFFAALGHTGDSLALYLKENNVAAIWKYDGTTFVEWNTDLADAAPNALVQLGDYIYYRKATASGTQGIYEIPKVGTPPVASTLILDLTALGSGGAGSPLMVAADNRLYTVVVMADETVLYEITPTSAASPGFGREILRQRGFQADAIWHHMGILFMAGRQLAGGDKEQQMVLYVKDENVGVVARLRPDVSADQPIVSTEAQTFDWVYFLGKYGPGDFTHEWTLFTIDMITGNVAGSTVFNFETAINPASLAAWRSDVFVSSTAVLSGRPGAVTALSPIAWWRMADTVDSAGANNTLTFSGSPTPGAVTGPWTGDVGTAFDGVDDFATVASEADVELLSDMSIECWFRPRVNLVQQVETFNSDDTWTAPAGVTTVQVEAWGAGGGGAEGQTGFGDTGGGGGGGGAYVKSTVAVTPGNNYTIDVGTAGTGGPGNGSAGAQSDFNGTTVVAAGGAGAVGGAGGAGGTTAASTGTTKRAGGAGGNGATSPSGGGAGGGGGGEGGGFTGTGDAGSNGTSFEQGGPTGGAGGSGGGGGQGGNGGNGHATGAGAAGSAPGGGGGGGGATTGDGGNGAAGRIVLTYDKPVDMTLFSAMGTTPIYILKYVGGDETLHFGPATSATTFYSFGNCTPDEWHHVVVTIDWSGGNRIIKGYLDGNLVIDQTAAFQPAVEARAVNIGRLATAGTQFYEGDISELAVYGSVLTPTQVESLFLAQTEEDLGAGESRVFRTINGEYVDTNIVTAYLHSAINDFALSDEKILVGFEVQLEPLLANNSIQLEYQLNQDGVWHTTEELVEEGATGHTVTISTAEDPVLFRNLQWRLFLRNGGEEDTTPEILSVTARATVAKGVRVWNLLLELYDDESEAGRAKLSGTQKYNKLVALLGTETVFEFVDGYTMRRQDAGNTYNVILDDAQIRLTKAGEGIARVTLREVTF